MRLFFSLLILSAVTSRPIRPGIPWFDTDGNRIEAHGGGFLQYKGTVYWYGETKKTDTLADHGINLYSSTDPDLVEWKFEGLMVKNEDVKQPDMRGPFVVERPKVVYNAKTGLFVM